MVVQGFKPKTLAVWMFGGAWRSRRVDVFPGGVFGRGDASGASAPLAASSGTFRSGRVHGVISPEVLSDTRRV